MTGMEILRAYAAALRERNAIELQIERLRIPCRPSGLTGVTYDKVGRNTNDPTAAAMQALDGLEDRLRAQMIELAAIAERGEAVLQTVPSLTDRTILRCAHVLDMSDEDIADDMHRSRSWVQQRRKEAEKNIS